MNEEDTEIDYIRIITLCLVLFPIVTTAMFAIFWAVLMELMDNCSILSNEIISPNTWLGVYGIVIYFILIFFIIYIRYFNNNLIKFIAFLCIIFWVLLCYYGIYLSLGLLDCINRYDNISILILISSMIFPYTVIIFAVVGILKI